jgi:hypothetical protein
LTHLGNFCPLAVSKPITRISRFGHVMHRALLVITLLSTVLPQPSSKQSGFSGHQLSSPNVKTPPIKSSTPLSPDEVAIYKAVLQQYTSDSPASLNVSAQTDPLDPSSPMNHVSDSDCLRGIQLENIDGIAHSYHDLVPEVLPSPDMKLVDPKKQSKIVRSNDPSRTIGHGRSVDSAVKTAFASGLFSMTEIAFDKDHHHALVSYGLWCGALCGNGSTLVFEKVGDHWKIHRHCGGWVS